MTTWNDPDGYDLNDAEYQAMVTRVRKRVTSPLGTLRGDIITPMPVKSDSHGDVPIHDNCGTPAQLWVWPSGCCVYMCPSCHGAPSMQDGTPGNEADARAHFVTVSESEVMP